jgi:DNA-binding NtrC family response regulator
MPCTTEARILVVGHTAASTTFTLQRLERVGCAFHSVDTIAEAEAAMRATPFDIVLAAETMPDGRGYDLTNSVVNHSATLLISIALSETCLWLPVVQHGVRTLGERALNSCTLQSEITALLNEQTTGEAVPFPRAVHGFMPESPAHRLVGGLDRRTGPEERRGLSVRRGGGPDKTGLP